MLRRGLPMSQGVKRLLVAILMLCAFFYVLRFSISNDVKHHRASPLEAISRLLDSDSGATATIFCNYEILTVYPHDPIAFTQGLIFHEGFLYESTGLRGRSTLRKVELETGRVLKIQRLPERFFGEGLVFWQDKLIQLTWQSRVGFNYNLQDFQKVGEFHYSTEGWGITNDGSHLIMSNGTATLCFLDPNTLSEIKRIEVYDRGVPIVHLNELEYINGEIYANVWGIDYIARIAPESGQVIGWVNLSGLRNVLDDGQRADALNGIAYDPSSDHIFVTGKRWPKLFEIRLNPVR